MHFRLASHIYAGKCNEDIIILDVNQDKYLSITDQASTALQTALEKEFEFDNGTYICTTVDKEMETLQSDMICYFLSSHFIEPSDKNTAIALPTAMEPGGLSNYRWDYKSSMAPFSRVPKITIMRALANLIKVEFLLKRHGIKGILDVLKKASMQRTSYSLGTEQSLKELSDSVDLACALYPKKIFCLGWASTFTLYALKNGIRANLVIGVQNVPFYAHAWAEVDGKVINDEDQVRRHLTPLVFAPFDR